jgi:hypothetical protein
MMGTASTQSRATGSLGLAGIRSAVQELHDSSREELRRLLDLYDRERARADAAEAIAAQAETTGKHGLAKLIRAGLKVGAVGIIMTIINVPVSHEENNLMRWNPPPITQVQEMSPQQMDELAHKIEQYMEQMTHRHDAGHDHDCHHQDRQQRRP